MEHIHGIHVSTTAKFKNTAKNMADILQHFFVGEFQVIKPADDSLYDKYFEPPPQHLKPPPVSMIVNRDYFIPSGHGGVEWESVKIMAVNPAVSTIKCRSLRSNNEFEYSMNSPIIPNDIDDVSNLVYNTKWRTTAARLAGIVNHKKIKNIKGILDMLLIAAIQHENLSAIKWLMKLGNSHNYDWTSIKSNDGGGLLHICAENHISSFREVARSLSTEQLISLAQILNCRGESFLHVIYIRDDQCLLMYVFGWLNDDTLLKVLFGATRTINNKELSLLEWIDNEGRTAVSYQQKYAYEQFLDVTLLLFTTFPEETFHLLPEASWLAIFVRVATQQNSIMVGALGKHVRERLYYSFFHAVRRGDTKFIQWMKQKFNLDLNRCFYRQFTMLKPSNLMMQLLTGPDEYTMKKYIPSPPKICQPEQYDNYIIDAPELDCIPLLYNVVRNGKWSGIEDFGEFLLKQRVPNPDRESNVNVPYVYDVRDPQCPDQLTTLESKGLRHRAYVFCDTIISHWQGVYVTARCEMLHYLLTTEGFALPPLELFLARRQHHLLKYVVDKNLVQLHIKVKQYNRTNPKQLYYGNEAKYSNLTLAEYLCYQAIDLGDLHSFVWLMLCYVKNKRFMVQGETVLETAIRSGNFLVLKWLLVHWGVDFASNENSSFGKKLLLLSLTKSNILPAVPGAFDKRYFYDILLEVIPMVTLQGSWSQVNTMYELLLPKSTEVYCLFDEKIRTKKEVANQWMELWNAGLYELMFIWDEDSESILAQGEEAPQQQSIALGYKSTPLKVLQRILYWVVHNEDTTLLNFLKAQPEVNFHPVFKCSLDKAAIVELLMCCAFQLNKTTYFTYLLEQYHILRNPSVPENSWMVYYGKRLLTTLRKQFVAGASIDKLEATLSTISRILELWPEEEKQYCGMDVVSSIADGEFDLRPVIHHERNDSDTCVLVYILEARYLHILLWLIDKYPDTYCPHVIRMVLREFNFHGEVYAFHSGCVRYFLQKESTLEGEALIKFQHDLNELICHVLTLTVKATVITPSHVMLFKEMLALNMARHVKQIAQVLLTRECYDFGHTWPAIWVLRLWCSDIDNPLYKEMARTLLQYGKKLQVNGCYGGSAAPGTDGTDGTEDMSDEICVMTEMLEGLTSWKPEIPYIKKKGVTDELRRCGAVLRYLLDALPTMCSYFANKHVVCTAQYLTTQLAKHRMTDRLKYTVINYLYGIYGEYFFCQGSAFAQDSIYRSFITLPLEEFKVRVAEHNLGEYVFECRRSFLHFLLECRDYKKCLWFLQRYPKLNIFKTEDGYDEPPIVYGKREVHLDEKDEVMFRKCQSEAIVGRVCLKVCEKLAKTKEKRALARKTIARTLRRHVACKEAKCMLRAARSKHREWLRCWARVIALTADPSFTPMPSWEQLKRESDFIIASASQQEWILSSAETTVMEAIFATQPSHAVAAAVDEAANSGTVAINHIQRATQSSSMSATPAASIDITAAVTKWLQSADQRYREMFAQRLEQLAAGDRSYALSKRLQHCEVPVYETKLDAGQRILWTETRRDQQPDSLLIWFVSKHDAVPRCLQRIEDSFQRMKRLPGAVDDKMVLSEETVLVDPVGNAPLKVYTTAYSSIHNLESGWLPPLRLTAQQEDVNSFSGSILLLGRSGTGKTVCVCDKMCRDNEALQAVRGAGAPPRQLFVCRSGPLCRFAEAYVKPRVAETSCCQFLTFDAFLQRMSQAVFGVTAAAPDPSRCVTFARFMRLYAQWAAAKKSSLDAVVVWTQIRSFITGSIEAVMQGKPLSLEQYLGRRVFSAERCRLTDEQRREAFRVYEQYVLVKGEQGLWDDGDRVLELLVHSKLQPLCCCATPDADYNRVYVDEVQDNTQAEIALYLLAAGMNVKALVLAGDPAQSVVEGVDFRFEEVRSLVYTVSGGKETIPRPVRLTVNYRSHAGVLNCAAAVLDKMFAMFPGAAKVLPRDEGLTAGPMPAVLAKQHTLLELLRCSEKLVVLVPDAQEQGVTLMLRNSGLSNLVFGIRSAKGLEFADVVIHDFFDAVAAEDRAAWKALLLGDAGSWQEYQYPQLEAQLKLLYTAITRACNRLIFTADCSDGASRSVHDLWCRYLQQTRLAETMALTEQDATELMTSEEWCARGIDLVLAAEEGSLLSLLDKAMHCFERAKDVALVRKCSTQIRTTQLLNHDSTFPTAAFAAVAEEVMGEVVADAMECGLNEEVTKLKEAFRDKFAFPENL